MSRRALSIAIAAMFFSFPLFPCISPEPPVPIVMDGSVSQGVSVAGNSSGFVASWRNTSNLVAASFSSNNGASWSAPATFGAGVASLVTLSAQNAKFLASWFTSSTLFTSVSSNGTSWDGPVPVDSESMSTFGSYAPSAATNAGFMVAWYVDQLGLGPQVRTSFSSDGTTWNPPVTIIPAGFDPASDRVGLAGNANGFLVSYVDNGATSGYVSFSSNNGATWGPEVLISATAAAFSYVGLGANSSGFLAAWIDTSNMISTSFLSDNGATWSAPVQIPSSLGNVSSIPRVSANGNVFIVSWSSNFSNHSQASCTEDNGATWSTPHTFSTTFVGDIFDVSVTGTNVLFTARDNSMNPISTRSTLSIGDTTPAPRPNLFFEQVTPNNPGRRFFD